MMRLIIGILLGCSLAFATPNISSAKSLRKVTSPAENPPTSFKGSQYVDSRGCVFIRAGFGGKVTWVPRVNRKRQVYCSKQNKPSLSGSQLAAMGQKPVIVDAPVVKAPNRKLVKKVTRKPANVAVAQPVVRQTVKRKVVQPKPTVRRVVVKRPVAQPVQTRRVVRQIVTPAQPQTVQPKIVQHKQRVLTRGTSQQIHPGDLVRSQSGGVVIQRQQGGSVPSVSGSGQIHPGDLVRSRRLRAADSANASVYVPKRSKVQTVTAAYTTDAVYGYTTVGTIIDPDVTPAGDAQTELIWTNTVPRRLVKRKVRVRKVRLASAQTNVVQSSKSYTPAATSSKRYVQVASFSNAANAGKTVRRFQANGLPVASRITTRGGKSYKVVYLGPFSSDDRLRAALNSARRAGFSDAVYR